MTSPASSTSTRSISRSVLGSRFQGFNQHAPNQHGGGWRGLSCGQETGDALSISPTALTARVADRLFRDTEHSRTLANEGDRRSKEPVAGAQPAPGSQK